MKKHAFLIAGTQSGCGKTTLSLALMAALMDRGLRVQPFKVGPDFIDPGLHAQVTGLASRSLDGWMLSRTYNQEAFHRCFGEADAAVVEGVMGLFDGYDGLGEDGSSAQMAKWLGLPVVLVVDARSMARSAAALVYGFSRFDPDLRLAGVIFNKIGGPRHLEYLKEAMAANLKEVPVLGGIPRNESIHIPERHLGLMTSDEFAMDARWRKDLARMVENGLDLDILLDETEHAPGYHYEDHRQPFPASASHADIAVAKDAAFCFYYPDNLDLLRRMGARLHFFSPLKGESIPEGASGVYLGGGYPEVHARTLFEAGREGFLKDLRRAAGQGMPIYAECGGLMTLSRFIETLEGERYPMAGVLPFGTRMLERRKALGYTEVALERPCLLGDSGWRIRGHEFHYSEIVEAEDRELPETVYEIRRRKGGEARREGYRIGSVLASYVHLHWGSEPRSAARFVEHCREYTHKGPEDAASGVLLKDE